MRKREAGRAHRCPGYDAFNVGHPDAPDWRIQREDECDCLDHRARMLGHQGEADDAFAREAYRRDLARGTSSAAGGFAWGLIGLVGSDPL